MVRTLRQAVAWVVYRLMRAYWWVRRPVLLGVRVLVADGNQVLLVKHSYREGWFLPGGSPEARESLDETARREAREETGLAIQDVTFLGIYSSLEEPESDHVAVFVSKLQDPGACREGHSVRSRDSEIGEVRWAAATRLPQQTTKQTRLILQDWRRERASVYRVVDGPQDPEARTR